MHKSYRLPLMLGVLLLGIAAFLIWKANRPDSAAGTNTDAQKTQYWISAMHPWIVMPEPGQCPICGMDLIPLDPAKFSGEIAIDPAMVQKMGVKVEPVITGPLIKTIRTVGMVDYDEENVRDVNTKVSGWIEKLYVDSLGAKVKEGDPLFSLYSPELYSAQQDYLLARRAGNDSLLQAARTRLQYFDVSAEQIEDLGRRGEPEKSLIISSPFAGVVTEKHANEGMKVDPGMQTYRIADLSTVWVMATIYEYQLPYLAEGQEAVMTLEYLPGVTLKGKVAYIYPYLDKKTREAQVRLEFENPEGVLKPGMFASIELRNRLAAEATLAPRSAVIDTGERKVAFVRIGEGGFEPRDVETGVPAENGMIQILSGLKPGENVVTSGQFLLDSEANMREALAKMMQDGSPAEEEDQATAVGERVVLPPKGEALLGSALTAYLTIQEQLAADSMEGVKAAGAAFLQSITELSGLEVPSHPHFGHERAESWQTMRDAGARLAASSDLADARLALGQLSPPLQALVHRTGVPSSGSPPLLALHCPMYFEDQGGAVWIQKDGEVRNPYMGARMLACFDKREALPSAGAPATDEDQP